jgi:hypothetical protein
LIVTVMNESKSNFIYNIYTTVYPSHPFNLI